MIRLAIAKRAILPEGIQLHADGFCNRGSPDGRLDAWSTASGNGWNGLGSRATGERCHAGRSLLGIDWQDDRIRRRHGAAARGFAAGAARTHRGRYRSFRARFSSTATARLQLGSLGGCLYLEWWSERRRL